MQAPLERVEAYLADAGGVDALVYRFEAGRAGPDDAATAGNWIRRMLSEQGRDGSWDGDLVATARALVVMHAVATAAGIREVDPGVGRAIAWLRSRQGRPGRFAAGCTPGEHGAGVCHHHLGGFFAVAPPEAELNELGLDQGAVVRGDRDCRFAGSALALEALLRWGRGGEDVRLHMYGLRRVLERLGLTGGVSPAATLVGLAALLRAPTHGLADRAAAATAIAGLAGRQLGDGSWSGVDVFQAVEVLLLALETGVAAEPATTPLRHATRLLATTQQENGSWGAREPVRKSLIAWRALRHTARHGDEAST